MRHTLPYLMSSLLVLGSISCKVSNLKITNLEKTTWIHGAANCNKNTDSLLQVVQLNSNTWMFRQNKCIHYEAPFIYLFLGEEKALLMDTGATKDEKQFPLYATVKKIIVQWEAKNKRKLELIVAHTHSHSDHTAADAQFKNQPTTTVVGLKLEDVKTFFGFKNWPLENATLDLGQRVMIFIPIPGHEATAIATYDKQSKILLTGDSFYPGRLYISDWTAFRKSTKRLLDFTSQNKVQYILGNHIEMTKTPGKDYPVGTTFHPEEHNLPLQVKDLAALHKALERLGPTPTKEVHASFIIYPK